MRSERYLASRSLGAWGIIPIALLSVGSVVLSIAYGSVGIDVTLVYEVAGQHVLEWLGMSDASARTFPSGIGVIVWQMRLPRAIMAALAGAIISVAGIFMQTLTQNPISDPYILGISAGASTGAVCAIIFGFFSFIPFYPVQISAFIGAVLALSIVLALTGRSPTPLRLVLLGVGVSSFFSALTTFVLQQAQNDSQLRSAIFWMLGSFSAVEWGDIPFATGLLGMAVFMALLLEKELDSLLLGDATAARLGVPVWRVKILIALGSALIVAVVVSKVGVIGFVGLIVPHVSRKLCGVRHRFIVPFAIFAGATFMVWADTAARTLFSPEEIPVGILTALIGAPLFVWIVKKGYSFGGQQ